MKVFISWSGERSRRVAELLNRWLASVIQSIRPWISTNDLDRGAIWFTEISAQLANTTTGIVCLTKSNKDKPWILFEAGALAKGLTSSRVYTFLIDLEPTDIQDPLAQFNHTKPLREDMRRLVSSINNSLEENKLQPDVVREVFDVFWPRFEEQFNLIMAETSDDAPKTPERDTGDLLGEVLRTVRTLDKRMRMVEYHNVVEYDNNETVPDWGTITLMPEDDSNIPQLDDMIKAFSTAPMQVSTKKDGGFLTVVIRPFVPTTRNIINEIAKKYGWRKVRRG